ncbi:MAG: cohesin domain-containing protein [Bacteroidota bacterium]|nr:cohesin domain-containing protein [Bacteroidota bacterium]
MKRIILYIILFTAELFSQNLVLTPDSQVVEASGPAEVEIKVENISSLKAYSITVKYNPAILKCTEVTKMNFLSSNYSTFFFGNIDSTLGEVKIDEAILGEGYTTGSGSLLKIKFMAKQGGKSDLNFSNIDFRDSSNNNVHVTASDGYIKVNGVSSVLSNNVGILKDYTISNYPNPFNPSTNIVFTLPEDQFVNITVYNIVGQIVAVLKNENIKKGSHIVNWDGNGCSSGVYIGVLRTMESTAKTKMILQK